MASRPHVAFCGVPSYADWPVFDFEFWDARAQRAHAKQVDATQAEERALGHRAHKMVCRYWLDGVCVAGDRCVFSHVYDAAHVPLCAFIAHGCTEARGCKFRHYYKDGEKPVADLFHDTVRQPPPPPSRDPCTHQK
jgi:hypothetical protein